MSPRFSIYLDAVRFVAAMVVLVSHFAYPRVSGGDYAFIRELNLGSDAVVLFFVLSGFVIAFTAELKDRTPGQFLFNRMTRVYSVAVPAVLVTLVLDRLGSTWAPEAYAGWWYDGADPVGQAFRILTFSNELWLQSVRLGTNGPLWSLSYEVWYYFLFAASVFVKGWRRVLLVGGLALVAGPKILLLGFSWWLGVTCYQVIRDGVAVRPLRAWLLALVPVAFYFACLAFDVAGHLSIATQAVLGERFVVEALRFSDEFLWNAVIGCLAATHFVGVAALLRSEVPAPEPVIRLIRWLAGASFSIYLVHYPVLQLLAAVLPGAAGDPLRHAVLLALTLLFCLAFAAVFERTLKAQRLALMGIAEWFQAQRRAKEVPPVTP